DRERRGPHRGGRGGVPARRRLGRPGRHRHARRPGRAGDDRARPRTVPLGGAADLPRRAPRTAPRPGGDGPAGRGDGAVIPPPANPVAVALDVSSIEEAERLAAALGPEVGLLKVGLELAWAGGPDAVHRITPHGPVFVDA